SRAASRACNAQGVTSSCNTTCWRGPVSPQRMNPARSVRLWLLVLAACSASGETRLQLELSTPAAVGVDGYEIHVGPMTAIASPNQAIEIVLPDELAGQRQDVRVWGLSAGTQVSFGSASATPVLGQTLVVALTLDALACGTPCNEGELA